jgi:WD40 repeat protein
MLIVTVPAQVQAAPDLSRAFFELPSKDQGPASTVSVSHDGSVVATGTRSTGNVTVYSVLTKKELWNAFTGPGNYFGVAVSGDGSRVYTFDGTSTVRMFSVGGGNVSLWSYSMGAQAYNVVTDYYGKIAVVGAQGKAFLFNQSGFVKVFDAVDTSWMYVAMTPDGASIVGACGKNIYFFDSSLKVVDTVWVANDIGSIFMDEVSIAISDDGQTVVASYLQPLSTTRLAIIEKASGNYYYPTFGSGDAEFRLSGDGRTIFITDSDGIYLFDTVSENVIWNMSMGRPPYEIGISNDGSMITAAYQSDGLMRIYGKSSSTPVEEVALSNPYQCILSGDGSTLVVNGDNLTVFRPSIVLEMNAPGAVQLPNIPVFYIRATVDGVPLLGANVTAENATYEVTEKGSGYYELRVTSFGEVSNSYHHLNITVSKTGLGSTTQEESVLIWSQDIYPTPFQPDYSSQFSDLNSQVSGLQIMVILLGVVATVTMVMLLLYVWRPRRSGP